MGIYIESPDWMDEGMLPRQRRLHVLRWNPYISSYFKGAVPEKGVIHNSLKFHEELLAPGVALEDVLELDEIGIELS